MANQTFTETHSIAKILRHCLETEAVELEVLVRRSCVIAIIKLFRPQSFMEAEVASLNNQIFWCEIYK